MKCKRKVDDPDVTYPVNDESTLEDVFECDTGICEINLNKSSDIMQISFTPDYSTVKRIIYYDKSLANYKDFCQEVGAKFKDNQTEKDLLPKSLPLQTHHPFPWLSYPYLPQPEEAYSIKGVVVGVSPSKMGKRGYKRKYKVSIQQHISNDYEDIRPTYMDAINELDDQIDLFKAKEKAEGKSYQKEIWKREFDILKYENAMNEELDDEKVNLTGPICEIEINLPNVDKNTWRNKTHNITILKKGDIVSLHGIECTKKPSSSQVPTYKMTSPQHKLNIFRHTRRKNLTTDTPVRCKLPGSNDNEFIETFIKSSFGDYYKIGTNDTIVPKDACVRIKGEREYAVSTIDKKDKEKISNTPNWWKSVDNLGDLKIGISEMRADEWDEYVPTEAEKQDTSGWWRNKNNLKELINEFNLAISTNKQKGGENV